MLEPQSEEELAGMIRQARGPLCLRGGGTRGLDVPGDLLSTRGLGGIRLYEPGALTMVAGAGTPLAEIEAALAAEGQMLAFEPVEYSSLGGAAARATIGGVFASNASGPRRILAGAARDFLLGVRFVDGMGTVVKNGGRVMKNVTGYDLVKLMAGAYGTLGVLSEVSFKLLPRPETQASLMIYGPDPARAQRIMAAALGSDCAVSGAVYCGGAPFGQRGVYLRLEGFEASVNYRLTRLRALVEPLLAGGAAHDVVEITDPDHVRSKWRAVAALTRGPQDLWRISARPSQAAAIVARLSAVEGYWMDWGGARIWAQADPGTDLRPALAGFEAHAMLVHTIAPGALPRFHPEPAAIARLSAGLRQRFDPRGILNRGLMG